MYENVGGQTPTEVPGECAGAGGAGVYIGADGGRLSAGLSSVPGTANISTAVELVAAAREAIGDEVDLGLEIHRNLRPEEAIALATELTPFKKLYYEDPLPPQSLEALEYVAGTSTSQSPLASGATTPSSLRICSIARSSA